MTNTSFILIIAAVVLVPATTGAVAVIVAGRKQRMERFPPALLFHAVPKARIRGLSHTTDNKFQQFAKRLAEQRVETLTVSQACNDAAAGRGGTTRSVILTFDDAFADFHANVFPVLTHCGIKATLFPITSYLGASSTWDIYSSRPHMDKEQLREISAAGHEIGSHTQTHPDLLLLSDDDVRLELEDSKKALEDILQTQIQTLSFPFGRWSRRIWDIARQCGYKNATVYGNHVPLDGSFVRVEGVYSFDSVEDILEKAFNLHWASNCRARSRIMPHYAKGSPIWRFRPGYSVLRLMRS